MPMTEQEALGESKVFLDFQEKISDAAKVDRPVLLIGERGTGKELAAERLHYLSERWQNPFVALNCAALPDSLIESELFGHTAGAFTDARRNRPGRFELADTGTLFLDEMALIPMNVQEKILRVVEYGTFERVGSSVTEHVNTRIIGATNDDLKKLSEIGKFKADLLDRLSFEVIFVPPLRERGNDIILLASHFATLMAEELAIPIPTLSEHARSTLLSYDWPGNVRELKNTVERTVYKCKNGIIDDFNMNPFENPWEKTSTKVVPASTETDSRNYTDTSPTSSTGQKSTADTEEQTAYEYVSSGRAEDKNTEKSVPTASDLSKFRENREQLEVSYITAAMQKADGNQKTAAALLNISYDAFRGMYRKYRNKELLP